MVPVLMACATAASAQTVRGDRNSDGILYGEENILNENDDGSTGNVDIGFTVNFFGTTYDQLFVNNNGNLTFGSGLATYTPFGLAAELGTPIIAPYFADVDTRSRAGTETATQGLASFASYKASSATGLQFGGHNVFTATWNDVGYFGAHSDKTNTFQVNLIDRAGDPGTAVGDFDIEFNYDQVLWETGDASNGIGGFGGFPAYAGYSAGTGESGTFFEMPGSGTSGALVDGGPNALISGSYGTATPGRYLFQVRNSGIAEPGTTEDVPFLPSGTIPSSEPGGPPTYTFFDAVSGRWYDPPSAIGYDFVGTSGTIFNSLGLPTGINSPGSLFDIYYGSGFNTLLGSYAGGSMVDFFALLGGGVDAFRIMGIDPAVDGGDPSAFPVMLNFENSTGNSFTMTPVTASTSSVTPEPASMALLLTGLVGIGGVVRRKKARSL